jgi:translation initiation factor 1
VVNGFVGSEADLAELARLLKNRCGVGGSAKDGVIVVQGNLRDKVVTILQAAGYARTK